MATTGGYIEASSGTLAAHSVGDLLIVVAVRWGSSTAPGLPSGWSSPSSGSTFSLAGGDVARIGWKIATGTTAESSGVWSNANSLCYAIIEDGLSLGAASGVFNDSGAAQTPALTMVSPGSNRVATLGSPGSGVSGVPSGTDSFWTDGSSRWSQTPGPVSSWPAQTVANQWLAVSVEVVPEAIYADADVTTSWRVDSFVDADVTTAWAVYTAVDADVTTSWQVYSGVNADVTTSWRVDSFADADVTTSWRVESYGSWQDLVVSRSFLDAVESSARDVDCYAEMVDVTGEVVTSLGYVPLAGGSVTFRGEQAEQWDGQFTIKDPGWVPRVYGDPLHPYSTLRMRVWWGVKMARGSYGFLPVATLHLEDPEINDTGDNLTITLQGRDALTRARRGGYGGQVLQLGGLTVTQALLRIFSTIAPHAQVSIEETSVTLPAGFEVGGTGARDAAQDWTEIASMAGFVVRADRMGVIHGAPRPNPGGVKIRLIEGPECRMRSLKRRLKGSKIVNRVVCRSTNPDLLEPVVAVVEDQDPDSPTWVGRYGPFQMLIESDAPATVQAATNMARAAYERNRVPAEDTQAQILPRPDLDYRDIADIQRLRAGAAGWHRVSGWSFQLPTRSSEGGPMTLELMTRNLI